MIKRLRSSFSARLLAGGLVLALSVIGATSAYLLISRDRQTRGTAVSNADNRALVARQMLQQITAFQLHEAAQRLAGQEALRSLLAAGPSADAQLAQQLSGASSLVSLSRTSLLVAGSDGRVVFTTQPPSQPHADGSLGSVRAALTGRNAAGVEIVAGQLPAYDVAVPVLAADGRVLGAVVEVAPLSEQLDQLKVITGYPTAFIPADRTQLELRFTLGRTDATPDALSGGLKAGDDVVNATYTGSDGEEVAGSFAAIAAPGETRPAGWIGVEIPLSVFAGGERDDEITVGLIALLATLVLATAVFVFVHRVVRRPVAALERGVRRIAGGDYTEDVPVRSADELGRLAQGVNRMRASIADYVEELDAARARLDTSVRRLAAVSRALTTTGAGVAELERAVVRTAAGMFGSPMAALLCVRDGEDLLVRAVHGLDGVPRLEEWGVTEALLSGHGVRVESAPPGWHAGGLVAAPMLYQGAVVGALAVLTPKGALPLEGDERGLAVLANNAANALENTRLFELKADFLATVQHELRTPLTAIVGLLDLLELLGPQWDEEHRADAVRSARVSALQMCDMVETMLDVSQMAAGSLQVHPRPTPVAEAARGALAAIRERSVDGLRVDVEVTAPEDLTVAADPPRLRQVLQALLDNAVKFTPAGGHVTLRAGHDGRPDLVLIEVIDDGPGIAGEVLPRVLEPFYQVDGTATRNHNGAGLGLALARQLTELHGGHVELDSAPQQGLRVVLHWPAASEAPDEDDSVPTGAAAQVELA